MSLYNECSTLMVNSSRGIQESELVVSPVPIGENMREHLTVPSFIKFDAVTPMQRRIFYISDLHLVHHIVRQFPNDATDNEVEAFIHNIVLKLFDGEFGEAVRGFESPVVMFGGDTSSSFSVAEFFYHDFISTWEHIVEEKYSYSFGEINPIRKALTDVSQQYSEWEGKHPWVKKAQKPIEEYSDKRIPQRIKQLYARMKALKEQLRNKKRELELGMFWESDYKITKSHPFIYAILGNHELWDFKSYDACVEAYNQLFEKCEIQFVCDKIGWLGPHRLPSCIDCNPETKLMDQPLIDRESNPKEYDKQMLHFDNIMVVGGVGFVEMNTSFNAEQGIYGIAISRDEEIARCAAWRALYHKAFTAAKECHSSLVVFTHMPITDWGERLEETSNCIFINGHTHRNIAYSGENNSFVFADNQVGYHGMRFSFKKAIIHIPRDPFVADPDGFREISCVEYIEFYRFVQETIAGTGIIEAQIKKNGAKLYVMKKDGYFGFFLAGPKGVYICNGGRIRKVGESESLDRYYLNFRIMIDKYITALMPLRRAQEQLSAYIKSFGGDGTIHGTIVDINFNNHIMLNTFDGTMTAYNSPRFGMVKTYPDIGALLHEHCPELEEKYLAIGNGQLISIATEFGNHNDKYQRVDIKNSTYALSRRVNALQRLFDKRILREWNSAMEEN